jgi:hypothetical protein
MNEFKYAIDASLEHRSGDGLEALGQWLCDTPCFPLSTTWPWLEAEHASLTRQANLED